MSWQLSLLSPILQMLVLSVGGFVLATGGITAGQLVAAASYVSLALGSLGLFDARLTALLSNSGTPAQAERPGAGGIILGQGWLRIPGLSMGS